jgi:hypothetical protein
MDNEWWEKMKKVSVYLLLSFEFYLMLFSLETNLLFLTSYLFRKFRDVESSRRKHCKIKISFERCSVISLMMKPIIGIL